MHTPMKSRLFSLHKIVNNNHHRRRSNSNNNTNSIRSKSQCHLHIAIINNRIAPEEPNDESRTMKKDIILVNSFVNFQLIEIRIIARSHISNIEVRQEAVQQALAALKNRPKPSMPMPSKRSSVLNRSPDRNRDDTGWYYIEYK